MRVLAQDAAVAALGNRAFDVVRYRERYDVLAAHLGLDFGAIAAALDAIPLCLRGEAHGRSRSAIARFVAERRQAMHDALPGLVGLRFDGLRRPGTFDVLKEAVIPFVGDLLRLLTQVDTPPGGDVLMSRLFSRTMGVAKRRRLNAEVAAFQDRILELHPDDPPDRREARLALNILGRDALIGTLGLSLHAHLVSLGSEPLRAKVLPAVPTHTGVPYVDREAVVDTDADGSPVGAGDTVRVSLESLQGMAEAGRQKFFGSGSHLCLGRPLSLAGFEHVSAFLGTVGTRVRVVEFRLRKDDVFAFPEALVVEVTA